MPEPTIVDEPRLYRETDRLDRRIDELTIRLTALDDHGTRGLASMTVQLTELAKDIAALETELRLGRQRRWQPIAAYVLGLIPVYVFIADQLLK